MLLYEKQSLAVWRYRTDVDYFPRTARLFTMGPPPIYFFFLFSVVWLCVDKLDNFGKLEIK